MKIYKASPIGSQEIPDLNLVAIESIPEISDSKKHKAVLMSQAFYIAGALLDSLPQGVTDRILGILALRKATDLRIPFGVYMEQPGENGYNVTVDLFTPKENKK